MLARSALCRLAVEPNRTSYNLPRLARFLQRALLARNASSSPAVRALSRAYATTTRATKPTPTVKKAVKAKAATKAAPKKKAASKKAPPKKSKTVAKKPVKKKKKAVAKKAAPRKRVKKVLSPEEKEKAQIAALRKKALKEPVKPGVITGLNVYIAENASGEGDRSAVNKRLADAAAKWKNLTPAEVEHYNHLANERTIARKAQLKAWIESHTPEEIRIANVARAALRRKLAGAQKSRPAHTGKLHDDRHVKKAHTPFIIFTLERYASGDLKGIKALDASKLIGEEWKALSASEKKKYEDEYEANKAASTT